MPTLSLLPWMIGPLGAQEVLIILVVALIVFGPRKLPQIGKTLGKSIAEFRRTSTELRSTLEREVQMEEFRAARTEISGLEKDMSNLGRDTAPASGTPASRPESSPSETTTSEPASGPAPTDPATEEQAEAADAPPDGAAPADEPAAPEASEAEEPSTPDPQPAPKADPGR